MTCQNYGCENETEGYDMYCKECQKKDDDLYQKFLELNNKRMKEINKNG